MSWEYTTEGCAVQEFFDSFVDLHANRLGEQGWELMHIVEFRTKHQSYEDGNGNAVPQNDTIFLKGYFKRAVSDANELKKGANDE